MKNYRVLQSHHPDKIFSQSCNDPEGFCLLSPIPNIGLKKKKRLTQDPVVKVGLKNGLVESTYPNPGVRDEAISGTVNPRAN